MANTNNNVDAVIETYREEKLSTSARYAYMENRIRKIMRRSASVVSKQIRKGKFTPKYFEVDFDELTDNDTLSVRLSDEDIMRLRGRIDRVDTCETDDGIYIRVIDYKSSNHEMDLAAVYEGRQLQLLVYLNAAMGMEKKSAQKAGKSPKIIPAAAILVLHPRDILVAKIHRLHSCSLREGRGAHYAVLMNFHHRVDYVPGSASIAETVAGHRPALRKTVEQHDPVFCGREPRKRRQWRIFRLIVQLGIHLVGQYDQIVASSEIYYALHIGARQRRACRIARKVQQNSPCFGRDAPFKGLYRQAEIILGSGRNRDRHGVGEAYCRRVADKARLVVEDFVARGTYRPYGQIDCLRHADSDENLAPPVELRRESAAEISHNRLPERRSAKIGRIVRAAVFKACHGSTGNMPGRIEVRFAYTKRHDVL